MLVLLFSLFCCGFSSSVPVFIFCQHGVNVSEAYAQPTDKLQFFYMQAPAFEGFFGNLGKIFNAYHTAFGVINLSTGQNYTIEYDAVNEVLNATLPVITKNPDGSTNLTWYDGGGICVQKFLNQSYYNAGFQFLTQVNGSVFNSFLDWTVQDNVTYSEYELMTALPSWSGSWNPSANLSAFINSSTCYDFNWRGIEWLRQHGAVLNYNDTYKHDFIATISSTPKEVDYNNPLWKMEIDNFYSSLRHGLNLPIEQWLILLEDLLLGSKFFHANQRYYVLDPMHKPYIVHEYLPFNLPGQ